MSRVQGSATQEFASGLVLLLHALPVIGRAALRLCCFAAMKLLLWAAPNYYRPTFHPSCLTAEYLTTILRSKGVLNQSDVVATVEDALMEKGGVCDVRRLILTYRHDTVAAASSQPAPPPSTLVVKTLGMTVRDLLIGALVPLSEGEHRAYTHPKFTRLMQGLQPKVFHFELSFFGVGTLLMEDMSGYRHKKSRDGATMEEMKMVLSLCAKIHSKTLNQDLDGIHREFQFNCFLVDQLTRVNRQKALHGPWGAYIQGRPRLCATMAAFHDFALCEKLFLKMRGFGIRTTNSAWCRPEPFCAILHGDVRLDNCFFDDATNTAWLVDWQVTMPRAPMLEIGWVLLDGNAETLSMPPSEAWIRSSTTATAPATSVDVGGDATTAALQATCKAHVNQLLLHYLHALASELTAIGYDGARPTMAYCQEMLPWVILNDCFYVMVSVAQIFKVDPLSDPDSAVVKTFMNYCNRLEWLLRVFIDPSVNLQELLV